MGLQGELRKGEELGMEARERLSVLCIAYHNLAVEHEYLKNYQSALGAYREGIRWAKDFLGEDHQIHQILQYSFNAVLKAQHGQKGKHKQQANRGRPESGARVAPPMDHLQDLITPRDQQVVEGEEEEEGPPPAIPGKDMTQSYQSDFMAESDKDASS